MKHKTAWMMVLGLVLNLSACGESGQSWEPPRDLSSQENQLVSASNLFGFDLMNEVAGASDGGNVFISPLSVSMALGMVFNGAAGSTETGMREALAYGDAAREDINQGYRDLIDLLTTMDPDVTMEIANSIWLREGFEALETFIQVNQVFFDAVVRVVDMADPGTVEAINAWVAEKTHDKIDKILDSTNINMVMVLINAIYFKASWTTQFDPKDTYDGTFTTDQDEQKTVAMMRLKETEFPYLQTEQFQAVRLPYGHGLFHMTILLPAEGQDVDALLAQMDETTWAGLQTDMQETELDLSLPKFELEWEDSLVDVLSALGMQDAFGALADFSGIKPGHDMFISDVKHKTYIRVDEEGTEAAAVTAVVVSDLALDNRMTVNRPFVFVIHDSHSQAILFMGKIVDPPPAS